MLTPEQLGKGLHELIMRELSYFLDHGQGKVIVTSYGLDRDSLGDELGFLGQVAAYNALEEISPLGAEDVMDALYQAFYEEIKSEGYPENELIQLNSYIEKRIFHLTVLKTKHSDEEFVNQIGETAAISVSEKGTPPSGLGPALSGYYVTMYHKMSDLLSRYQLEGVEGNVLEEVISRLAVRIFKVSVLCADLIEKDLEKEYKIDSAKYRKVVLEFLFLFMHLADRDAFSLFDAEKRALVVDSLYGYITGVCVDGAQYITPKFETSVKISKNVVLQGFNTDEFNQRHREYENYKVFPAGEKEGWKGALFWEFSKHISVSVVDKHEDLQCRLISMEVAMSGYRHLHIMGDLSKILKK